MVPLTGWSFCKKITVQTAYLDANQTDFPWVIFIDADTDIGASALANGYDIRFTASDGTTLLSYERVSFAIAVGAATGRFNVKTSLATSPATDIYIHYGKAGAPDVSSGPDAFDSSFKRVWHMGEAYSTAAGNYKDSKGVGDLTLTDADADSGQGTGPITKAVDLNGDADYLTDADHADHDPGGAMTIEAWINLDSYVIFSGLATHSIDGDFRWDMRISTTGSDPQIQWIVATASGLTYFYSVNHLEIGQLYYAVCTWDKSLGSNRSKIYLNGALENQANGFAEDITAGSGGIVLGYSQAYQNGKEAEVRYSKGIGRSDAWVKFTYRNITEADNCLTIGTEELSASGLGQYYGIDLSNKI